MSETRFQKSYSDADEPHESRWLALFIILLALFMNLLDVTIVNVSLPTMQADLGASSTEIEWVVAGFILTFALGLLPFGRLGDIVGRKRMFMIGVGSFTIASILCGMAPNMSFLIVARLIQGAAGAVMTPQVLSIAQTIFPPHERAAAFSLFGLTAGLATVTGPVLGGLLLGGDLFGLEWRPIFLINVPVGIFTVIAAAKFIPPIPGNMSIKNDFGGIAIVSAAMFLIIFPLIEGRNYEWAAWCFAMMAASFVFFVAFVFWEKRQKRVGGAELLPIDLMKNGNFIIGAMMSLVFFSAMPSFFMIFALYLQQGYGLTPLWSGLTTMPFSVGVLVASVISGRIGFKWQKQRIAAGLVLLFAGMLSVRILAAGESDVLDSMFYIAPLLFGGIGLGVTISPLFQTILAGVPQKDAGSGSGALQALQQAGGALGVAVVSEIFFRKLAAEMATGATPQLGFSHALTQALTYNLIAYAVVLVGAFLLKNPERVERNPNAQPIPVMD
ncbi:MFS transporter [Rhizobium sp. L1K21]|uniref:MFS transporter n=1 Tax=Rhizobium sp. L1K21 TaxID=2954933 RepID=UPI002092B729|nr:MFS transporter [Rhizobium sp. L1K21]MCO6185576.1 MFS transporter [Rhizobium sp. L1K21]